VRTWSVVLLLAALLVCPARAQTTYTSDQLNQLVAPIALFPDSLLAQVLMACAYPSQVAAADQWVQANPGMSDATRTQKLASQSWDPSVSSLTGFPDLLHRIATNLDWATALGEAFIAQQGDVLGAVQAMRAQAQAAGNLQSGSQVSVSSQDGNIDIDYVDPSTAYWPLYDPTTIYGGWAAASWLYPGIMVAPIGYAGGRALAWGAGYAVGASMYGGVRWGAGTVTIGNNYWSYSGYRAGVANSPYVRTGGEVNWSYNNVNRNVNYTNASLQRTYNSGSMAGSRSLPYTPPAGTNWSRSNAATSTPFGTYDNGGLENRASNRGYQSTGLQGGDFNRADWGGARSVNYGGFRAGGFGGGRR